MNSYWYKQLIEKKKNVDFYRLIHTELFVSIEKVFQFDVQFLDTSHFQVNLVDLGESLTVLFKWSSGYFNQVQHEIVYKTNTKIINNKYDIKL